MNTLTPTPTAPDEILIVEDSPTQAQRLRHILEREGYSVAHAANGRLALEAARRRKPALIVSDVVMPEMDGYELCRSIKADSLLGDIPVILVTTLSDPGDVIRGLECRADNFILKPYDDHYLLGRVQFVRLNREVIQTQRATMGVEIFFNGQRHFITADRLQILNLLLSTYEAAIQRTKELTHTQAELQELNQSLQETNLRLEQEIAERARTEQALRRAHEDLARVNARLDQASRHKDEFLANMSHELRTPLNAILGLSEALLESAPGTLTPRQIKSLTTIATSGQHLLELINDILDLSKIEAGKLELHPELLASDEFCQSCLAFVRTQALRKKITVAFDADGRTTHFRADRKRFKQVLVNLLTNAVKFTPEGGRIGLTVSAPESGDGVRFTVWDTGIGIAAEDQPKLFRAFTQIDSGLSRAQEGTGLGLALVAKLVELHGGGVALESATGQGSRFTVTLPWEASATPADGSHGAAVAPTNLRRALVVEDDIMVGELLVHSLQALGFRGRLVGRGELVMDAVVQERPELILLDIALPGEDGWQVLQRMKAHPETHGIPVVVVSATDDPEKSRELGAAAHFTKPFKVAEVMKFVGRLVAPPAPADPTEPSAPTAITPMPSAGERGPIILLAEDNEANIQTIGGYLEDKGYALHCARNGVVAVQLARELRPALILMDIQMPVMDGYAAMREIRADAALSGIPIVALTALAMPGDRERCLAAGASDYLSKPVSLKALAALAEKLVSRP